MLRMPIRHTSSPDLEERTIYRNVVIEIEMSKHTSQIANGLCFCLSLGSMHWKGVTRKDWKLSPGIVLLFLCDPSMGEWCQRYNVVMTVQVRWSQILWKFCQQQIRKHWWMTIWPIDDLEDPASATIDQSWKTNANNEHEPFAKQTDEGALNKTYLHHSKGSSWAQSFGQHWEWDCWSGCQHHWLW